MTLYDDAMKSKPQFKTFEEALEHYTKRYNALGGDLFWEVAEHASKWDDDMREIHSLRRTIDICKRLIVRRGK